MSRVRQENLSHNLIREDLRPSAFVLCIACSLGVWKGRVGWGAIFNRRRDKEGIISNAGKVTTDKHLIMGERGSPWISNADS